MSPDHLKRMEALAARAAIVTGETYEVWREADMERIRSALASTEGEKR